MFKLYTVVFKLVAMNADVKGGYSFVGPHMGKWYRRREKPTCGLGLKFNQQQQRVQSRAPRLSTLCPHMDDRPHKAHRPAQSGAKADKKKVKGKERQGFNEKVLFFHISKITHLSHTKKQISHRLLLQNQVEEQTVKDAATSSVIKLVFMSPSSTAHPMMAHHLSSLP